MTKLSTTSALWLGLLLGCIGTEGGNPHEGRDMGAPDGATSSDMFLPRDFGASDMGTGDVDGGNNCDAGTPLAVCGEPTGPTECPCATGTPVAFSETPVGSAQSTTLLGPTASGGFVAIHAHVCTEDCPPTPGVMLEVHRFDASGDLIGEPIVVTRSSGWEEPGALLEDDSLVLVFGDERAAPRGFSDLYFGRLDLETGDWLVEPQLAIPTSRAVQWISLASASDGYGVLYAYTADLPSGEDIPETIFARLTEAGLREGDLVRVAEAPEYAGALVPRAGGFLMARWASEGFDLVPLAGNGSESGSASSWSTAGSLPYGPMVVPRGDGVRVAWSDSLGVHTALADANGAMTGAVTTLGGGILTAMVERADGTAAIVWTRGGDCAPSSPRGSVLSRVAANGSRVQPDQLVVPVGDTRDGGGTIVDSGDGLVVTYVTRGSDVSTTWRVNACVP